MIQLNPAKTLSEKKNPAIIHSDASRQIPSRLEIKRILSDASIPVAPVILQLSPEGDVPLFALTLRTLRGFVLKSELNRSRAGTLVITGRYAGRHGNVYKTDRGHLFTEAELTQHVANITSGKFARGTSETAFVEPMLAPSTFFAALFPAGLSDIRFAVENNSISGCMLVLPTLASFGRPHLHMGAIGVAVDADTGVTWRARQKGIDIDTHPENGLPLLNHPVPDWSDIVSIAKVAAKVLPVTCCTLRIVPDQRRGPLVLDISSQTPPDAAPAIAI